MRGPLAPVGEHPFLAEMRQIFFAAILARRKVFRQSSWEVARELGDTLYGSSVLSILYKEKRRWVLQSIGNYARDAVPCFVSAVLDAAEKNMFQGGRGTPDFVDKVNGYYRYRNDWGFRDDPEKKKYNVVNGHSEAVYNSEGELRGWGTYHAMLLPGWDK